MASLLFCVPGRDKNWPQYAKLTDWLYCGKEGVCAVASRGQVNGHRAINALTTPDNIRPLFGGRKINWVRAKASLRQRMRAADRNARMRRRR